jgi:hypothetical protein
MVQVLVPIMVLRDHRQFNPLEPGHVFSLDVEKIKEQVQRLALPDQKIRIISGVHNLQVQWPSCLAGTGCSHCTLYTSFVDHIIFAQCCWHVCTRDSTICRSFMFALTRRSMNASPLLWSGRTRQTQSTVQEEPRRRLRTEPCTRITLTA